MRFKREVGWINPTDRTLSFCILTFSFFLRIHSDSGAVRNRRATKTATTIKHKQGSNNRKKWLARWGNGTRKQPSLPNSCHPIGETLQKPKPRWTMPNWSLLRRILSIDEGVWVEKKWQKQTLLYHSRNDLHPSGPQNPSITETKHNARIVGMMFNSHPDRNHNSKKRRRFPWMI